MPPLRLSTSLGSAAAPPEKSGAEPVPSATASRSGPALRADVSLGKSKGRAAALRPFAEPATPVVVELKVNSVSRGEAIAHMTADGRFLVPEKALGESVRLPDSVPGYGVDAEAHVLLSDIRGAQVVWDEKNLVLSVALPPELFPVRVIDLAGRPMDFDMEAMPRSAHVNYRLGHFRTGGQGNGTVTLATEGVIALGHASLRNVTTHARSDAETASLRVETQLSWENRSSLTRLALGDAITPSLALGSSVPLGGITYSRVFSMDPYLVRYPSAGFRGLAEFPSQVDLYVGNNLVSRQRVEPGPFEIRNFNYYGGQRDVRIVVRDIFGREQAAAYPFYFADQGLAEGLDDFTYQVGAIRRNFGIASNDYGDAAFSAFHRWGITDSWTVGFRGEGMRGLVNAGPEAVFRHALAGTLSASAALSRSDDDSTGQAFALAHSFQDGNFSSGLFYQRRSETYATLASQFGRLPTLDVGASVGYSRLGLGSLNLAFARQRTPEREEVRSVGLSYSVPVFGRGNLVALYRRDLGDEKGYTANVILSLPLDAQHHVSFNHVQESGGRRTESLQLYKQQQDAAGLTYSLNMQQQSDASGRTRSIYPRVEWGTRYATLAAEGLAIRGSGTDRDSSSSYNLSISGALVAAGGHFAATRPIDDSFAVVQVTPPLAGVRVRANGQDQDPTDADGRTLLPRVVSYSGTTVQINDRDIPIEYAIERTELSFSAPQRSGTVVEFALRKVQGFTGIFTFLVSGQKLPLKHALIVVEAGGGPLEVPTSTHGDFYVENLPPGTHRASTKIEGQDCSFDLVVPESKEIMVALGEIATCSLPR